MPMAQTANVPIDALPCSIQAGLRVKDVMRDLRTVVPPDAPMSTVVTTMDEQRVPLVAVGNDRTVYGIITDREIVGGLAKHGAGFPSAKAVEIMAPLSPGIEPETPLSEAARTMRAAQMKWLPVTSGPDVISIMTQEELTRAATLPSELGCVGDIMSHDVITLAATAPLLDAARVMNGRDISCIVAVHGDDPVGVVTAKDLRRQFVLDGRMFDDAIVADVMGFPIAHVEPSCPVGEACITMSRANIHRLVVMENGGLRGIVTQTDVVAALDKKRAAEEHLRQQRMASCKAPVFAINLEGITTYVNPAFLKFFGSSRREDFIRRPFLPGQFWADPSDRIRVLSDMERIDLNVQQAKLKAVSNRCVRTVIFSAATRNLRGETVGRQGILWKPNHSA